MVRAIGLLFSVVLHAQTYDILLTNCRVIDGAGNPWVRGSVAISGDRIAAVGHLPGAAAKVTRDCKGLVAAPGFIDVHSHGGRGIREHPEALNQLRQGVTTIIDSPDGGSPLPVAKFLAEVEAARPAINFGMYVGQGSVREAVIGLAGRKATPEEISRMRAIVEQSMREGAMGLSTGLFYVPGNYTPVEEVIDLAKVAGRLGGFHISHMRDEADRVLDSVKETIRIGEEGGLPTQVTHHKIIGRKNWGASNETLKLIDEARARGVDVTLDQYPYTASSTGTEAMFPQWSLEGGRREFLKRLAIPEPRARIKAEIVRRILEDRGAGDPRNIVMARCTWQKSLDGKNLKQITDERGLNPTVDNAAEAAMWIQERGGCSAVYHAIDEADLERIMRYPLTMIASDGGIPGFGEAAPHPRSYGTFARVLGRYVRERKVLTLEDAIRRMTSLPAARLGLDDRGQLRAGMKADLVVFDPAVIADKATYEQPHQYAVGVEHVWVNGKPAVLDGKITGERNGVIVSGRGKR